MSFNVNRPKLVAAIKAPSGKVGKPYSTRGLTRDFVSVLTDAVLMQDGDAVNELMAGLGELMLDTAPAERALSKLMDDRVKDAEAAQGKIKRVLETALAVADVAEVTAACRAQTLPARLTVVA